MVDYKLNVCSRCGQVKPRAHPRKTWCRACTNIYNRERRLNMSEETRARDNARIAIYTRLDKHRLRWQALQAYGGKCECCGEDQPEFLAIDHIDGGGSVHRKLTGTGKSIARWLYKQGYPPGFRVLCHNCNAALGHHGYCPHVTGSHYLEDVIDETR